MRGSAQRLGKTAVSRANRKPTSGETTQRRASSLLSPRFSFSPLRRKGPSSPMASVFLRDKFAENPQTLPPPLATFPDLRCGPHLLTLLIVFQRAHCQISFPLSASNTKQAKPLVRRNEESAASLPISPRVLFLSFFSCIFLYMYSVYV